MVNISVVSYLNSKAFVSGLETNKTKLNANITLDIPSESARKIIAGETDIALVPVAILPELDKFSIISNYCIGAFGKVHSVMLYSRVPLNNIHRIILDFHSRTSITLVKVLSRFFWKINPEFIPASDGSFISEINENTAAVVIGDRTFKLNGQYEYEFDLSEEWTHFTGLPFVFACWVSRKEHSSEFLDLFNESLKSGLGSLDSIIQTEQINHPEADIKDYLENRIHYNLGSEYHKGMNVFSELQKRLNNK
jgi:chorismate dehydratase